jgi:hypothetical protein
MPSGKLAFGCWRFDAYGNEIFYRTMSLKDFAKMERTNKVPATGETFISPSEAYASGYEGVTVRVTTKPGTMQQLTDVGVSANPGTTALFPDMPSAVKGSWTSNNAMLKLEKGVVNTGLGKGVSGFLCVRRWIELAVG